jgi:hypothetical protein
MNGMNASTCVVDRVYWSSRTSSTIEGLIVLADVTGDNQWRDLYVAPCFCARPGR